MICFRIRCRFGSKLKQPCETLPGCMTTARYEHRFSNVPSSFRYSTLVILERREGFRPGSSQGTDRLTRQSNLPESTSSPTTWPSPERNMARSPEITGCAKISVPICARQYSDPSLACRPTTSTTLSPPEKANCGGDMTCCGKSLRVRACLTPP